MQANHSKQNVIHLIKIMLLPIWFILHAFTLGLLRHSAPMLPSSFSAMANGTGLPGPTTTPAGCSRYVLPNRLRGLIDLSGCPIDTQSKGGDFYRRRKLRMKKCRFIERYFLRWEGYIILPVINKIAKSDEIQEFKWRAVPAAPKYNWLCAWE